MTYELCNALGGEVQIYTIKEDPGISHELRTKGVHEPWLVKTLKQSLSKDMVGIDIGANLGFFAMVESQLCKRVYAIEPVPNNYVAMTKSLYYNRIDNVSPHPVAIGNKDGMSTMVVTKQSNWGTLVKDGSKFYDDFYDAYKVGEIQVKEFTLDSWVKIGKPEKIDFIRMDVEGYEHEIIEGASKTLQEMEEGSLLFIEFHNKGLNDYQSKVRKSLEALGEWGFSPFAAFGKMGKEIGKSIDISGDFVERFSNWDTASFHLYFRK